VDRVLGTNDRHDGIQVHFSRPVLTETLRPGVVDLWVIQGGGGRSGQVEHLEGRFVRLNPAWRTVPGFVFRHTGRERLNEGDRILITIRTDFILDECCRPVDGNHVGGRVPLLPDCSGPHHPKPYPPETQCLRPPYGPWTSGNGQPGGTFESWFYCGRIDHEERP
jgi:hypothetical protein